MEDRIPVIIDCDTGTDDAGALMMACASDRLDILAVTTVAGNVALEHTYPNTLNVLKLMGRADIPVAKGADRPLCREGVKASAVHGSNGLMGYEFDYETPKSKTDLLAVPLIAKILEEREDKVTIIALGPLTNIAALIVSRPDLVEKIDKIIFMGVSYKDGNPTPITTFNVQVDPEAFHICINRGIDFYAVPLDTLRNAYITKEQVAEIKNAGTVVADFIYKTSFAPRVFSDEDIKRINASGTEELLSKERIAEMNNYDTKALLDQGAVGFAIAPELFIVKKCYCEVECHGSITTGYTFVDMRNMRNKTEEEKNIYYVDSVDREKFADLFMQCVWHYGKG